MKILESRAAELKVLDFLFVIYLVNDLSSQADSLTVVSESFDMSELKLGRSSHNMQCKVVEPLGRLGWHSPKAKRHSSGGPGPIFLAIT
jgi:hypothetical protein